MEPYQERVVHEKKQLDEKTEMLENFIIDSPFYKELDYEDKVLMNRQMLAMQEYSHILGERIARF